MKRASLVSISVFMFTLDCDAVKLTKGPVVVTVRKSLNIFCKITVSALPILDMHWHGFKHICGHMVLCYHDINSL